MIKNIAIIALLFSNIGFGIATYKKHVAAEQYKEEAIQQRMIAEQNAQEAMRQQKLAVMNAELARQLELRERQKLAEMQKQVKK